MLGLGSTSAPPMAEIALAGGSRGRCGGLGYRRARDRETGVVGGSRSADRSGRLGLASPVPVDVVKVEIIHMSICGGWEGVVLVQLVLAGQETLEGRHGGGGLLQWG